MKVILKCSSNIVAGICWYSTSSCVRKNVCWTSPA